MDHPPASVTPLFGNGMLFIFTEPSSPKIKISKRDGRYALHCSVGRDGPLIEVWFRGMQWWSPIRSSENRQRSSPDQKKSLKPIRCLSFTSTGAGGDL